MTRRGCVAGVGFAAAVRARRSLHAVLLTPYALALSMTPRGWMGSSPKKADGGLPLGGPADPYLHDAPETLAWHAKLITVSASFAVSHVNLAGGWGRWEEDSGVTTWCFLFSLRC